MLTRLHVEGFKGLNDVTVPLRNPTVLTGEFEGKTSLLQALMVWRNGLAHWDRWNQASAHEKDEDRAVDPLKEARVPPRIANMFWPDEQTGSPFRVTVEGCTATSGAPGEHPSDHHWSCGFEFPYASLDAEPVNVSGIELGALSLPQFSPAGPISGLAVHEPLIEQAAVKGFLDQGHGSAVLRNLCMQVLEMPDGSNAWEEIADHIERWHQVRIEEPMHIVDPSTIICCYQDQLGVRRELITASRGLLQTLNLLCLIELNRGGTLLLDTPDAGLSRSTVQQHINLYRYAIRSYGTQIITAAHSDPMMLWASSDGVLVAHRESDLPQKLLDEGLGETARYISK